VLVQNLILSANVGYTHATLASSSVFGVGLAPGVPVQEVPDLTSSVSLAYRHSISDQLTFTARIENDYVGPRTDSTFTINHLPPYDLAYARAGVESEHWSAVLFANNLFNKRALLNDVTQISANLPTFDRVAVSQPLTIGIDLNYRFGAIH
jgi:outer membrane receptor protein involved in Fe transport